MTKQRLIDALEAMAGADEELAEGEREAEAAEERLDSAKVLREAIRMLLAAVEQPAAAQGPTREELADALKTLISLTVPLGPTDAREVACAVLARYDAATPPPRRERWNTRDR